MKKAALTAALLGSVALAAVTIAQTTSKPIIVGSSQPVSLASGKISDGNSIWVQLQIYDRLMEFKPGTAETMPGLALSMRPNATSSLWTINLQIGRAHV